MLYFQMALGELMEFFEIWRAVSCVGAICAAASSVAKSPSFKLGQEQLAAMSSTPQSDARNDCIAALRAQMASERGFSQIMGCAALAGIAGLALGWSHSGVLFAPETPSFGEIVLSSLGIMGCVGPLAKIQDSEQNLRDGARQHSKLSYKRDAALLTALDKAEITISAAAPAKRVGQAPARKARRL